jgi:alanine racemase
VNLSYSLSRLSLIFNSTPELVDKNVCIQAVSTDTRTMQNAKNTLFFALKAKRNGADFVAEAYAKGCRNFVVEKSDSLSLPTDTCIFFVENSLQALQKLAKYHRDHWNGQVLVVAGGLGKTSIKEWLYYVLSDTFNIVRSPKSYNSQMGVALSLLQLDATYNFAIIEAGFSEKGETKKLLEMISPDYGILSSASVRNTSMSSIEIWQELLILFENTKWWINNHWQTSLFFRNAIANIENKSYTISIKNEYSAIQIDNSSVEVPYSSKIAVQNAAQIFAACLQLNLPNNGWKKKFATLPQLALRMEFYRGKNNNLILNDTYTIEPEGLQQAAYYLRTNAIFRHTLAIIALTGEDIEQVELFKTILTKESIKEVLFCHPEGKNALLTYAQVEDKLKSVSSTTLLFKGSHNAGLGKLAQKYTLKQHTTYLEIDRKALRHNLSYYKSCLPPTCKMLVMVKAASYGSGSIEMAQFLSKEGINYLGVAYADEGVELRKAGIQTPILVMNAEPEAFEDIIQHGLQPAIFSMQQLDAFVYQLILAEITNYPIHIKLETGMKRLGFEAHEIPSLINYIKAQPEVFIQSVYTHFAESDNLEDKSFSISQIHRFKEYSDKILSSFNYPILLHMCNTSGIENFPEAHFDMVRLGIGLFGVENTNRLHTALSFKTHVSSIKSLQKGESVGYNRSYMATKNEKIAVLPIGYADGLRRALGNEKAYVLIAGKKAPLVGNICMDMCFANVSDIVVKEGDEVELFGLHLPVEQWAQWLNTISYEVLCSISPRVKRIWME